MRGKPKRRRPSTSWWAGCHERAPPPPFFLIPLNAAEACAADSAACLHRHQVSIVAHEDDAPGEQSEAPDETLKRVPEAMFSIRAQSNSIICECRPSKEVLCAMTDWQQQAGSGESSSCCAD